MVWNIFPYIGNSSPKWLIFFRGVETTNQLWFCVISIDYSHYSHIQWGEQKSTCHRGAAPFTRGYSMVFRQVPMLGQQTEMLMLVYKPLICHSYVGWFRYHSQHNGIVSSWSSWHQLCDFVNGGPLVWCFSPRPLMCGSPPPMEPRQPFWRGSPSHHFLVRYTKLVQSKMDDLGWSIPILVGNLQITDTVGFRLGIDREYGG